MRVNGSRASDKRVGTHISLGIVVLEIEGMLPDVDADDGDQVQERVLVRSGGNLQTLGGRVESLKVEMTRYRSNLAFN